MSDNELVLHVLNFTRELNALQRKYSRLLPQFRRDGRMDALLKSYREEAEQLCALWLTRQERSTFKSLPDPPTFAAVEGLTLSTVNRRGNQAAIELLASEGHLDFRFNLLYKDGKWRISTCQRRYHSGSQLDDWTYVIL